MGRRRKNRTKKETRTRSLRPQDGAGGTVAARLAEAVRRGRSGDFAAAERQAQQVYDKAGSAAERRVAGEVLGEALLHGALSVDSPAVMLSRLTKALRKRPASSRLGFYRALALLQLGRADEGNDALQRTLDAGERELAPAGASAYARQLSRLLEGEGWSAEELADRDDEELRLIERLLSWERTSNDRPAPYRPTQLPLFRPDESRAAALPGRSAEAEASAAAGLRIWGALLALEDDAATTAAALKEAAARPEPGHVRARVRYYQGVAALSLGERREALELWRAAAREGLETPWLQQNLVALLSEAAQELAKAGRWSDVVELASDAPPGKGDRILGENTALAHEHLGYQAARAGHWSEAARHWRRAMAWRPGRALAQNLALAEEALGRWQAAAEAWQDVLRRRPRKPDHPDHLSDDQIAALWRHAGECYERAGAPGQELTCVDSALRYAPDDTSLRLRRAVLLAGMDSRGAAEVELDRLLDGEPGHVEALRLRAILERAKPHGDPAPLWRRLLETLPRDEEARDGLAASYLRQALGPPSRSALTRKRQLKKRIGVLEQALAEVPGHPMLLTTLGKLYAEARQLPKAVARFREALDAAPRDLDVVGGVLHETLHAAPGAEDLPYEAMAHARGLPEVLPEFWLQQGERVLECELPGVWFDRFVEEALAHTEKPDAEDSRARVLFLAYEIADTEEAEAVARRLERRIREEVPKSGAVELVAAWRVVEEDGDLRAARRLFRTAAGRAQRARDVSMQELIEQREDMILNGMDRMMRAFAELFEP